MNSRSLLRDYCKYAYYTGIGDYWFEPLYRETPWYRVCFYLSFTIYLSLIVFENLAAWLGEFPDVEKNSSVMFAVIHTIVLTKMFLVVFRKEAVKQINIEMANVGSDLEEAALMRRQYSKVRSGILCYMLSVYASLGTYAAESARRSLVEGILFYPLWGCIPFYTVVTYYPKYEDESTTADVFRVLFYIIWLVMMMPMIFADCFPITHVIILSFKFITLRRHFERVREVFDEDLLMKRSDAVERMRDGFLQGILMHQKLIRLADDIHRIFGIIMSLQVCESSAVAVLLLLRLAQSPRMELFNAFMTYTFVASLFFLLGLNLWNAGEMTYQASSTRHHVVYLIEASLLSTAMFQSGWHLAPPGPAARAARRLALVSCAQAQKPLVLKAFGIQDLSYGTFVSGLVMASWGALGAPAGLCLLLHVVYSSARYSQMMNTEAPYYGTLNNSVNLGSRQPIRSYSEAFSRWPWVGRVVPSATNTGDTRCTVTCVRDHVFISASRCLLGLTIGVAAVHYKDLVFETKALITPGDRYRTKQAFEDIGVLLVYDNKSLKAWDTIEPVSVERSGSNYSWFQQFEVVQPKQADYMVMAFDPRDQELFYELEAYPGLLGCEKLLYRAPVASWENYMKPEYFRVPCICFCNFDEFNVKDYNITDEYDLQCRLNIWIEGAPVVSTSSPRRLLGVTTWGPGLFTLYPKERYAVGLGVPNSAAYRAAMRCADVILRGAEISDAVCEDF
ncbi:unnamed protein product [Plutella xylostella]|uniref:(diamondback moth) hypothetical protein n=1 Tax=Plutella xylostella TaxID=51655 RepID=A0A8S4DK65_PLUXY|nr:unnamed protein product [Plutella xylostella]